MSRNLFIDARLVPARTWFTEACLWSQEHQRLLQKALATYGNHGPEVSGCGRAHFPESVKNELRRLAYWVKESSDRAWSLKPPRYRDSTMRLLAQQCAQRYGSGFHGPQP